MGRAPAPTATAALLAGLLVALAASPADGQLRRDPGVPHASGVRTGQLMLGLGTGHAWDVRFPLSGLEGDLWRALRPSFSYAFADGALIRMEGDLLDIFQVQSRGPSSIPLDDGVEDGTVHATGEVRLATLFRAVGGAEGWSGGFHLEVKLPSASQGEGIGSNTTDVAGSLYGSYGSGRVRLTAEAGVAILEAPLRRFSQNDVLVYGAEAIYRLGGLPLSLTSGLEGRVSTRSPVPVGTEDLGAWSAGGELRAGGWLVDAGLSVGYADVSPDWEVRVGVARLFTL